MEFNRNFLNLRYFGLWCISVIVIIFSYFPLKLRNIVLTWLGIQVAKVSSNARRRAQINLHYCFPLLTDEQQKIIIRNMYICAVHSLFLTIESVRHVSEIGKRVRWYGLQYIQMVKKSQRNVIIMVPHGWAVALPAIVLALDDQKIAAMFHSNLLVNWLWNSLGRSLKIKIHAKNDGIKPFIQSIRRGYWGYYMPDQDHGFQRSEFANFFATYKATLPVIGRLAKLCNAQIIPLFPVYDKQTHYLNIYVRAPMEGKVNLNVESDVARQMNKEIEALIKPNLEQYVWTLKLLKTRKKGEMEPYLRQELYPK